MASNQGDNPLSSGGKPGTNIKEGQKLFYVHIPQDSSIDSSRVLLKSRAINSPSPGVSFSAKLSSLPNVISTTARDSKANFRDVTMEPTSKMPKISISQRTSLAQGVIQGTSQNFSQKSISTSGLPMRPMKSPITVTLTNNRAGTTIIRSTNSGASSSVVLTTARAPNSGSDNTGTTLNFANSSPSILSPVVCSPLSRPAAPTQALPKCSKPFILQPKILAGSKKDATNTKLPQKFLPIGNSVRSIVSNKSGNAYSQMSQNEVALEPTFNIISAPTSPKRDSQPIQKREGYFNSFTPPPLILQAGANSASKNMQSKSGTTTISIVTGKSAGSTNNVSILPLQRGTTSKPNMMNFKITNGQIQRDNSVKIDNLLCESRPFVLAESSLRRTPILQDSAEPLINKTPTSAMKDAENKDILQEAITAAASDSQENSSKPIIDKVSPQSATLNAVKVPDNTEINKQLQAKEVSYPVLITRNPSSGTNIFPLVLPVSSASNVVPVVSINSSMITSLNNSTVGPNTLAISTATTVVSATSSESENPGITTSSKPDATGPLIRADSVTVPKIISKDEEKMEPKPDDEVPILHLPEDSGENDCNKDRQEEDCNKEPLSEIREASSGQNSEAEQQQAKLPPADNNIEKSANINEEEQRQDTASAKDDQFSRLFEWQNGLGCLSGTEIKFRLNEFNALEIIEDNALEKVRNILEASKAETPQHPPPVENKPKPAPASAQPTHVRHSRKPSFKGLIKDDSADGRLNSENSNRSNKDLYDICCCKNCGCYGLSSEFIKERGNNFCTTACSLDYEQKEQEWNKERLRNEKQKRTKKPRIIDKEIVEMKIDESSHESLNEAKESKPEVKTEPSLPGGVAKFVHPWMDGKNCFSWVRYLDHCGKTKGMQRAAPLKHWSEPFPCCKNLFKPGMKLEGIDPQHQSLFCVMTVTDIIGYRIRLHIDGYSDIYDFWCNADSPFIFQVGWCEKNGRKLETPPGIVNFSWKLYLEHCTAQPAPRQGFSTKNAAPSLPSSFRVGSKLEVEDKKTGWVCVATIVDILDNRLLINYDGWDKAYDMWFEASSPYLHPMCWCAANGVDLYPPKNYSNSDSFTWLEYLQNTNSSAVPARAFKTRPAKDFRPEMKLEAVDKRNPMLIRVATIAEVKDYKIKLHFDGWDEIYDYWIDDDSPDIHPQSWCAKTGHPLQPPLTPEQCAEDVDSGVTCGTAGCKGFGHIKGLIYNTHHTAYGCPYSPQNINKDHEALIVDRLESLPDKKKGKAKKPINLDTSQPDPTDAEETQKKRVRKRRRFFDELSPPEIAKSKMPRVASDESIKASATLKPFLTPQTSLPVDHSPIPQITIVDQTPLIKDQCKAPLMEESSSKSTPLITKNEPNIDTWVHQSIFNPAYNPKPKAPLPQSWKRHKHIIPALVNLSKNPQKWSIHDIADVIRKIPGCESASTRLRAQEIDGESLLLITQNDLVQLLQIKLGPAIKIMTCILHLRSVYES